MNVHRMNAPASLATSAMKVPVVEAAAVEEEHVPATITPLEPENEEDDEIKLAMEMALAATQNSHLSPKERRKLVSGKNSQMITPPSLAAKSIVAPVEDVAASVEEEHAPATIAPPEPENEEDDEIKLAMEMAMAAAQNPHLSPLELHKLVGGKNKQYGIVDKVQQEKELKKTQEKEEAQQRWQEKKEHAFSWWKGKTEEIKVSAERRASEIKIAASQKAEELKNRAERRIYREEIRQDRKIHDMKKKIKVLQMTLKAHRLQGNRVETRHVFKRQRQEKNLIQTVEKLDKTRIAMTGSSLNVHEYAKAMMRASKRWKKQGTDEELMLEAQLCRNMHQMLTIEKQSGKVKKSTKEIKKYLQRCKGWLSDKKAFCEMHNLTLEATTNSMKLLYEETLFKQDALIAKLIASEEFKDINIKAAATEVKIPTDESGHAHLTSKPLRALRGLPMMDSIRIKKKELKKEEAAPENPQTMLHHSPPQPLVANFPIEDKMTKPMARAAAAAAPLALPQPPQRKELFVDTADDCSVNSNLSDPDDRDEEKSKNCTDTDSENNKYGNDAPWTASESSELDVVDEYSTPPGLVPPSEEPIIPEKVVNDTAEKTSSKEVVSEPPPVEEPQKAEEKTKAPAATEPVEEKALGVTLDEEVDDSLVVEIDDTIGPNVAPVTFTEPQEEIDESNTHDAAVVVLKAPEEITESETVDAPVTSAEPQDRIGESEPDDAPVTPVDPQDGIGDSEPDDDPDAAVEAQEERKEDQIDSAPRDVIGAKNEIKEGETDEVPDVTVEAQEEIDETQTDDAPGAAVEAQNEMNKREAGEAPATAVLHQEGIDQLLTNDAQVIDESEIASAAAEVEAQQHDIGESESASATAEVELQKVGESESEIASAAAEVEAQQHDIAESESASATAEVEGQRVGESEIASAAAEVEAQQLDIGERESASATAELEEQGVGESESASAAAEVEAREHDIGETATAEVEEQRIGESEIASAAVEVETQLHDTGESESASTAIEAQEQCVDKIETTALGAEEVPNEAPADTAEHLNNGSVDGEGIDEEEEENGLHEDGEVDFDHQKEN